jgi:hypothetical protein
MRDKQFLFALGAGGNCINFIASLCHYNYYQRNDLMTFSKFGDSHNYTNKNNIQTTKWAMNPHTINNVLTDSSWDSLFKIVNISPDLVTLQKENFAFTFVSLTNDSDLKFCLLNHFLKGQPMGYKKQVPLNKEIFEQYLTDCNGKPHTYSIHNNLVSTVFDVPFCDIYKNKQKIINFIENLTENKSTEMLSINYDRYLNAQRDLLQKNAPWFYDDIGHTYFT